MRIIESGDGLAIHIAKWKKDGKTIGFVPTMGFLHEGHLALMKMAHQHSDKVVTSIFVNPRQFGPEEDLDKYPRDIERDTQLARNENIDILFIPTQDVMYPPGYQTTISVPYLAKPLCGKSRPVHFDGVATVVTKLFNLVQPDVAVFGEKDYQQLALIRQMVRDLNFKIQIVGHPIVREPDGLAMSSRNKYLNAEEREDALSLSRGLQHARDRVIDKKELPADALIAEVREIISAPQSCRIDYVEIVDSVSLAAKQKAQRGDVLAVAAFFNEKVRLIDNTIL